MDQLRALRERLRGTLWLLPSISVLAALALGTWLAAADLDITGRASGLLVRGDAEAARAVLGVVAGAIITVTSLVFSLTLVVLQVASSQYSPRLLRNFLQDRRNQVVLSVFLSTFAYCIAVLRSIEGAAVPEVAMAVALLFVLASLAALVFVIHHIAHSIRSDTIMRDVEQSTLSAIERNHPDRIAGAEWRAELPDVPDRAVALAARRSGFVQTLTPDRVVQLAVEHDAVIRFVPQVGQAIVSGDVLAWVWSRTPGRTEPDRGTFERPVNRAVRIGFERTLEQDAAFGIRQLVDIGVRALSTGVNDPATAEEAIDHLAVVMVQLVGRRLGSRLLTDNTNIVRVAAPRRDFAGYLELACDQIRRYGSQEPGVVVELLRLLGAVAAATMSADRRQTIAVYVERVVGAAERDTVDEQDLVAVRGAADRVRAVLQQPVTAAGPPGSMLQGPQ